VHKREIHSDDASPDPTPDEALSTEVIPTGNRSVSPARDRASEKIVQRATQGLMRRESRRRVRVFLRRIFLWSVLALASWLAWYWFADRIPMDLLNQYWEELKDKTLPILFPEPEAPTGI
jgi:hypothetical protein